MSAWSGPVTAPAPQAEAERQTGREGRGRPRDGRAEAGFLTCKSNLKRRIKALRLVVCVSGSASVPVLLKAGEK